ncbi:unnamed protein product [Prorocentrum cordatum]|uniref:Uncharacterized protein n=2 Tax=Prorocentrum cordatum TaxID=2364126 RepID=A0ABN9TWM5_9DINO|nr:unnamed protein product [Polarella glacialis]
MKRLKRSRALRRWRATGEDAETKKEDGKDGNEGKKENEADKPEALADAGWIIQEPYVSDVLDAAKAASGLPVSAVDFVEMCGGCSRVPWVKEMCSQAFGGKELSTTMNADECVARGCTLQAPLAKYSAATLQCNANACRAKLKQEAAILSPLFKAREFKVEDTSRFGVRLGWQMPTTGSCDPGGGPVEKCKEVFPQNSLMNMVKALASICGPLLADIYCIS